MRCYLRHPSSIPIELRVGAAPQGRRILKDVGEGGLCFRAEQALEPGVEVHLVIPVRRPPFEADGVVAWCREVGQELQVGVRFTDAASAFALRMIEQLCHIESYRLEVARREGRELTSEAAAEEWIGRFAADFPS
jgi:PilZ domain